MTDQILTGREMRPAGAQAASPRPSRSLWIWLMVPVVLWCVVWMVHSWGFWEDDAFIHLEFARSIAEGHGFVFDGRLVNGDSACLWAILLAVVHFVIPAWWIAGKALCIVGVACALSGAWFLSFRLTDDLPGGRNFASLMVLLLVVNPYFCYWSFSGMETLAAAGLGMWAVWLATVKAASRRHLLLGCLCAGLGPLFRPEMALLSLLLCPVFFLQWKRTESQYSPASRITTLLTAILLGILPVCLWCLYAHHAFGAIIPDTNAAKRDAPGRSVLLQVLHVYGFGFPVVLLEVLVAVGAFVLSLPRLVGRRSIRIAALESLPLAGWLYVAWSIAAVVFYLADHTYVQTRYVYLTAPGLLIVLLAWNLRRLPRVIFRTACAVTLVAGLLLSIPITWLHIRNAKSDVLSARQMAEYIRRNVPPTVPVAVHAIGAVAFYSQHPVVDIGAVTNPGVIPFLYDSNPKDVLRWAISEGAQYYISPGAPCPGAQAVYGIAYPAAGWYLRPDSYGRESETYLWKLPGQGTTTRSPLR